MIVTPKDIDQFDSLIHGEDTKFQELTTFDRNGLAPVSQNDVFGLINQNGEVVIPFEYTSIVMSTVNAYSVSKNDKWGFITKSNQILIPIEYELTSDFIENVCAVKLNNKWGFIDLLNNVVIPIEYEGCTDYKNGLAGVVKNDKWGLINKNNELLIDYQYEYLTPANENFISFGKATDFKIDRPDILAYFPYFLNPDHYLMHFGLITIDNELVLDAISEIPVLETFDGKPVVRQNYQLGYLNDTEFIAFDQYSIDPYEEKILKKIGVMK